MSGCVTPLNTKDIDQAKIFQLLTSLFIVSLFLERSLEVFITTWRGPTSEKLNNKIQEYLSTISKLNSIEGSQVRVKEEALAEGIKEVAKGDLSHPNTLKATEYLAQTKVESLKLETAFANLRQIQQDQSGYKLATRCIALCSNLLIGILISTTGILTLGYLFESPEESFRLTLFGTIDVLLTGGLIAGGSDGIHRILQAVITFMDATAKRAKGETP